MPRARRAGRRRGAGSRARAAPEHRRDAAVERLFDQLRAYEVDVRVDAAGGDDAALSGDRFGPWADHDVHAGLDVGVAGFADPADAAVADADIGFDDSPMIEDHGIGDDCVDRALRARRLPLPHAVADDLTATELHLLTVDRAVALDLDDELGIGQAQPIAGRWPEHGGISGARDLCRHGGLCELAVDPAVEADHASLSSISDERHLAALPGLEARRRP